MATTTVSNAGEDWLRIQQLIFENDGFLKMLSSKGLSLFLIGVDLFDILDGENRPEFHLLLTLAHAEKAMTEQFPNGLATDPELITSLKTSFRNGNELDETSSVLKIKAAETTIHLYLHSLLHPGAVEGEMRASSDVFVANKGDETVTAFLSTNDFTKPADLLDFCWAKKEAGQKDGKSQADGLVVSLPEGTCPDRNRTFIRK
ncbi:hypothetical protein CORC01_14432 [Colletotrichum orchidophilum]|uniref:Uncharacterized protein n=1 Tax=Colletotrichum orchidophilum TaxID=1209926 RepID=A0A1G4AMK3_9PEZI|nr:uncharacterized protein CORC01_14432 [Colletotrichum orchidophilum]OHE90273.1 hypothetical protein CORC01_14432 [Colletotrichum orchidophilum]